MRILSVPRREVEVINPLPFIKPWYRKEKEYGLGNGK